MRLIDDIIRHVEANEYIGKVHKQILITRIEKEPTCLEIEEAEKKLDGRKDGS
jgi:hypothetical protein